MYKPWLAVHADAIGATAYVYLDPEGWLVATDTHILAAVPCEITDAPEGFAGCLLPPDALKAAAKGMNRAASVVAFQVDLARQTIQFGDTTQLLPPQSIFPMWRKVIPAVIGPDDEATPPSYMAFNPWLMEKLALAIGIEKNSLVCFYANSGQAPAVLTNAGAAIGVLMPGYHTLATAIRNDVHALTARLSQQRQPIAPKGKRTAARVAA